MGAKSFAAAAGAGLLTVFSLPLAYHSRDLHFFPTDVYKITEQSDGPHIHIINSRMSEIANIRLIPDKSGQLVGEGVVMGDTFKVVVGTDDEALFVKEHGPEMLWLGRDVVHVLPSSAEVDREDPEASL
jgi:hypothetical protein